MSVAHTEIRLFAQRARFVNEVFGVLAFTLAIGAASTEAPRFFAFLCMGFLLLLMAQHGRQYARLFKLWREVEHPFVQIRRAWRHYLVFLIGWCVLGLVAVGAVDKQGLKLFA